MKITGAWISPDREHLVLQLDGEDLIELDANLDDRDMVAAVEHAVPAEYEALVTQGEGWPE